VLCGFADYAQRYGAGYEMEMERKRTNEQIVELVKKCHPGILKM